MLAWFALIWMLVPAAAAQGFDQSLDGLVRQRVITSQERKLLRGGGSAVPMERSRFEEACRTVKGMARTLRHSLEALHGISIGPGHPILPWMVQHGAFLISRGQIGSDGKTAYDRRRGRSYKKDLPAFGERVL